MNKTRADGGRLIGAPMVVLGAARDGAQSGARNGAPEGRPAPERPEHRPPLRPVAAAAASAPRQARDQHDLGATFVLPVEELLARMQRLSRDGAGAPNRTSAKAQPATATAQPASASAGAASATARTASASAAASNAQPAASNAQPATATAQPANAAPPAPAAPRPRRPRRNPSGRSAPSRDLRRAWSQAPVLVKGLLALPLIAAALGLGTAMLGGRNAGASASMPTVQVDSVRAPEPEPEPVASNPPVATTLAPSNTEAAHSPPPGTTPERAAADAVAEGRYGAAAQLYAELARAQPERAVWREAARILAERAGEASRTP